MMTPRNKFICQIRTASQWLISRRICLLFGAWCLFAVWGLEFGVSACFAGEGFGPPISVPHDSPKAKLARLHNLIDQTREEALAKSHGCLECHRGIEEMHTSPNVVL